MLAMNFFVIMNQTLAKTNGWLVTIAV